MLPQSNSPRELKPAQCLLFCFQLSPRRLVSSSESSSRPLHCVRLRPALPLLYFGRRMKHGAYCCPRHSSAPCWCSLRQTPSSAAVFTMPLTNSPAANGRTPNPLPTLCFARRRRLSWLPCLLSPWRCRRLPSTFAKQVQRTHRRRLWLQQRLQVALLLVQAVVLALQCHCRSGKRRCQRWRRSRATRGRSTT